MFVSLCQQMFILLHCEILLQVCSPEFCDLKTSQWVRLIISDLLPLRQGAGTRLLEIHPSMPLSQMQSMWMVTRANC